MIKLIKEEEKDESGIILMKDMEPYDIAEVVENSRYIGNIVMRTASVQNFEVMDLTDASMSGSCWAYRSVIKVKLLPKGTRIVLEVV